jgi:hypothetical protein
MIVVVSVKQLCVHLQDHNVYTKHKALLMTSYDPNLYIKDDSLFALIVMLRSSTPHHLRIVYLVLLEPFNE